MNLFFTFIAAGLTVNFITFIFKYVYHYYLVKQYNKEIAKLTAQYSSQVQNSEFVDLDKLYSEFGIKRNKSTKH